MAPTQADPSPGDKSPEAAAALGAALARAQSPDRNRVLRVRITDVETEQLKVGLSMPIGLVPVATRLGARFLPPGPEAAEVMQAIEQGTLAGPVVVVDSQNGERIEVSLDG
jgi:hypothetical protein